MRHRTRAAWLLFAASAAGNLVLLYWPRSVDPGGITHLDKVAHALSFALVMATGVRAGLAARALAVVLAAHAVTSEVVQHTLLAGRSGDPADVVADVAGVAGVLLVLGAASWRHDRSGWQESGDDGATSRREPHPR